MSENQLENIGSTDKLAGFDELKEDDQDMVKAALEQGFVKENKEAMDKVS